MATNFQRSLSIAVLAISSMMPTPAIAGESATSADAFVDTVGVNVHLHYTNTAYYTRFPAVEQMLLDLGVRHIREGAIDTTLHAFYDHLNELGKHGIKTTFIFNEKSTPDFIRSFPSRVPSAFEAFEAPNEFNASKDPNWDQTLRTFVNMLYSTVKADPSLSKFPIIGPSITKREADVKLGDISSQMDYGNLHNYFGGRNPGTTGWGPMGYGSIVYNQRFASYLSASRPLESTETGYCDLPSGNCAPPDINGIYEPRMFLEQSLHGIVRTIQYELLDEGNPSSSVSSHYGLLTADLQPKPSYNALKSMIGLLKDPGPSFQPHLLDVTITSGASALQHELFEKRDGSYYLALWLETPEFDVDKREPIAVNSQTVTVAFPGAARQAKLFTYDVSGGLHESKTFTKASNLKVQVDGRVTFIRIEPKT